MKIRRHRLDASGERVRFAQSPNTSGILDPQYLIIHFTAGSSAAASISWLINRDARASAHLVIGRDGSITQLVAFNRVAWHAGASQWEGLTGLNQYSIGIELDNAGRLERKGGQWCAWFGNAYPQDQVMEAVHGNESTVSGWHVYTPEQIEAALSVSQALVAKYRLKGIAGHDEISPGRKVDPGPAFPMGSFRARLLGRSEDAYPHYRTITVLNIRTGPGTNHERLPESPLSRGAWLEVLDENGPWRYVALSGRDSAAGEVLGWVHGGYLQRAG